MHHFHTFLIVLSSFCGIDDNMFKIKDNPSLFKNFLTFLVIFFGESDETEGIILL